MANSRPRHHTRPLSRRLAGRAGNREPARLSGMGPPTALPTGHAPRDPGHGPLLDPSDPHRHYRRHPV